MCLHSRPKCWLGTDRPCKIYLKLSSPPPPPPFIIFLGRPQDKAWSLHLVMDLNFLYSDFVMDDREVLFHSAPGIVIVIVIGSLNFFRTGQKVRTVCLPARSTLILTICLYPWRAWTVILRLYILCFFHITISAIAYSIEPGVSLCIYMFC